MNNELQAVIEYMERERGLERETVIEAIESALLSAAKRSLGPTRELRVTINRKTFNIKVLASLEVVERKRSSLACRSGRRANSSAGSPGWITGSCKLFSSCLS